MSHQGNDSYIAKISTSVDGGIYFGDFCQDNVTG